MFGKIRVASSSSLENLELERTYSSSKVLKDDSLSIYEATLMKLKVGSQRSLISPSTQIGDVGTYSFVSLPASDPTKIEESGGSIVSNDCVDTINTSQVEEMTIDSESCLQISQPSSVDCHSISNSKEECKTVSVLYLFSKYRKAHPAGSSSSGNTTTLGNAYSVSASNLSTCNSLDSMGQQLERVCELFTRYQYVNSEMGL